MNKNKEKIQILLICDKNGLYKALNLIKESPQTV